MIFTREELELKANRINKEYFPERLEKAIALDPYDLLDKLCCSYDWKYISPNKSILGITFFAYGSWYIWKTGEYKEGDICQKEFFPKQTIIINQAVLDGQKNKKEENFIVAHEAGHWIKDQDFFENSTNGFLQICQKNDFGKTSWHKGMSELEIIERQTNYLAAAILMPRTILRKKFFEILRWKTIPETPIKFSPYMKRAIGELSKIFNVNFNPVKYRLVDIGVLERE